MPAKLKSATAALLEGDTSVFPDVKPKATTTKKAAKAAAPVDTPAEVLDTPVIELPATKADVTKLKIAELDAIAVAEGFADDDWSKLSGPEKKQVVMAQLFDDKPSGKAKALKKSAKPNDQLLATAHAIEKMSALEEVQAEIVALMQEEGLTDFRLGGLLQRASELVDLSEGKTFRDYVQETFGLKYRKARYLIQIYNSLVEAGIAYEQVQKVTWTKLRVLVQILTAENVDEWVEKALSMNQKTLEATVKAALEEGVEGAAEAPVSNLKTKSFKLAEDQIEVVEAALDDIKQKANTEHNGVALEYMAQSYLGGGSASKKTDVALVAKLEKDKADLEAALAEAQAKLDAAGDPTPVTVYPAPHEFWAHVASKHKTNQEVAVYLFGDNSGFSKVFPGISLAIDYDD